MIFRNILKLIETKQPYIEDITEEPTDEECSTFPLDGKIREGDEGVDVWGREFVIYAFDENQSKAWVNIPSQNTGILVLIDIAFLNIKRRPYPAPGEKFRVWDNRGGNGKYTVCETVSCDVARGIVRCIVPGITGVYDMPVSYIERL